MKGLLPIIVGLCLGVIIEQATDWLVDRQFLRDAAPSYSAHDIHALNALVGRLNKHRMTQDERNRAILELYAEEDKQ